MVASFTGVHLTLAATNAGATVDEDALNSVLIKMSAIFVSIGMMVLVSRMDFLSLLFVGGSGAGAKKAA